MKLTTRFKRLVLIVSAVHALWMVSFSILILNSSLTHWDDTEIATFYNFMRKEVMGLEQKKPPQDKFFFIDVSKSNELIDCYDSRGNHIGEEDYTDRAALARLFKIMNQYPVYEYALCDIQFFIPSPNDSLLKPEIEKTPKLLVSTHFDGNEIKKPLFDVKHSVSDYEIEGGIFFKYKVLYNDSIISTPARLLQEINGAKISGEGSYVKINDQPYFNNFILDYRIREWHYNENKEDTVALDSSLLPYKVPTVHLKTFLEGAEIFAQLGNDDFFNDSFKDRIVVIGDFSDRDIHETIVGDIAGPVILLNAYLALAAGDNKVKWSFLIYLYFGFLFISYVMFHPSDPIETAIHKLFPKSAALRSIMGLLNYTVIILLISFIGYLLFDFQISIIILALYTLITSWAIAQLYDSIQRPSHRWHKKIFLSIPKK